MASPWSAKARRWLGGSTLATSFVLAISCVSVLDLGDHAGAAQVLCDHLEQCFGPSDYDCVDHVATGLEQASPEDREAWLAAILDDGCLAQCSAGKTCLDATPVCNGPAVGCLEEEQCCGFLDKAQTCDDGLCCREDGQLCDGEGECCSECNAFTGTCGGEAPCQPKGEPCEDTEDCCSDNCLPEGVCGFRCREQGEDCDEGSDCCSGVCEGSRCACRPEGDPCSAPEECCLGECYLGQCNADPGCVAPTKSCIDNPLECCQPEGADDISCDPDEGRCCLPDGSSLGPDATDDLSVFCCSTAAVAGTCCGDTLRRCEGDTCCEGLTCRENPVNGQNICCKPFACADPCVAQPAPVAPATAANECAGVDNSITLSCLAAVCKLHAECCCDEWSDYCVSLLTGATSGMVLPECSGICSATPTDPNPSP